MRGLLIQLLQDLSVWACNPLVLWVSPVLAPFYFCSYKMTKRNTTSDFSEKNHLCSLLIKTGALS